MDFDTAYQFLLRQTLTTGEAVPDTFIACLRQGKPPIPGQVTSLLLALKVIYQALKDAPALERPLVQALFTLTYEGRQCYSQGLRRGIDWPPLLDDDLTRLAQAAQAIIAAQSLP